MDKAELKALINRVKSKMRVTKVVATRAVKTRNGEFFAGFSAAWDSVQDDGGGHGADLDMVVDTEDVSSQGMTLRESRVAQNLLAMQADIGAYEAAFANGALSKQELEDAIQAVKHNYALLIKDALVGPT